MFSMNDAVINDGGVGGNVVIDLENYMTRNEGVMKGDFQGLETVVNGKASMNHKHGIGDIKNLQEALILKSETGHKHSIDDVSGLEGRLTAVESKIIAAEERLSLLERVNVQQQNEINSLKETLTNHAEAIETIANTVGIEVEK